MPWTETENGVQRLDVASAGGEDEEVGVAIGR